MNKLFLAILTVAAAITLFSSVYIIDETEQVVVTQFRAVVDVVTRPGLHVKVPVIQQVKRFPKNLLEWDGQPGQVPTKDKTFIEIDTFGRWRIVDARKFFEKVNNIASAQAKLDDIIDAAVRNLVTSHVLIETVRNSNRPLGAFDDDSAATEPRAVQKVEFGRARMTQAVLDQAKSKLAEFGIELMDVRFKRIMYNERVLRDVFNRMIAERKQIAEKYRSEGRGESAKIKGEKEKELKRISSAAYKEAESIKGKADGEATSIYSRAYSRDPEFYSFIKTLEMYKSSLDSTTWAVLSTKADFLKYLKKYTPMR
ncbi:MAG: protease modulator HflC [Chitinivibrionales bacterium]|nr:protease modulator HflC [Chitinivibrionales bacterium]MBD3395459.1 protease modulator HflC [Chitinivibrionales bacterium]